MCIANEDLSHIQGSIGFDLIASAGYHEQSESK